MPSSRPDTPPALVNLGLTPQEATVYEVLVASDAMTVKDLASKVDTSPHALYRVLKQLEDKELISQKGSHPSTYWAIPPSVALERMVYAKKHHLDETKEQAVEELSAKRTTPHESAVELLPGKEQFFDGYIELAKRAEQELLIISIGEPVSDEILLVNRDAVERGAEIKIIFHTYDESNQEMIERYLKMGWQVRHYPDWGFHLTVVDGNKALLAVNNPEDTDERVGMLMQSGGMAKAMRDYFYSVWEKAMVL